MLITWMDYYIVQVSEPFLRTIAVLHTWALQIVLYTFCNIFCCGFWCFINNNKKEQKKSILKDDKDRSCFYSAKTDH